jgi:hypothetical protein
VHLVQMVPPQRSRLLFTDWIFTVSYRREDFSRMSENAGVRHVAC